MTKISDHEYDELKKFLAFYSERCLNVAALPPDLRPMACLAILEGKSRKMAEQGLKQAINDIIEKSRRMSWKEVEKLDLELRGRNLVALSELRRRFSRQYKKILARRKINNETEYYLVKGIVSESGTKISEADREILCGVIAEFENSVSSRVR